jgi:hypothetical protein
MKYLKVILQPIKIKGDLDDETQLQQDVYEKVMNMIESETLSFQVDDEEEEDDCDF